MRKRGLAGSVWPSRRASAVLAVVAGLVLAILVPLVSVRGLERARADDSGGGEFVADQFRLYDSPAALAAGTYWCGATAAVPLAGTANVCGASSVPAGASAVQVSFTAVGWAATGWLAAWAGHDASGAAVPYPGTSMLNVNGGDTESNTAVVPVGADGTIQLKLSTAGKVIIDVQGYFTATGSGGGYHTVSPVRIANTRDGNPTSQPGLPGNAKLVAGSTSTVQVGGLLYNGAAVVPANATAVFANVEVMAPSASGWVEPYAGTSRPGTSLNFVGDAYATAFGVTIPLNSSGQFAVYTSTATAVYLVVDIEGYYTPDTAASDGAAFTASQQRLTTAYPSSRLPLAAGATVNFAVAGVGDVPVGSVLGGGGTTAVMLNVQVVNPGAATSGWLRAWPYEASEPTTGGINYDPTASGWVDNLLTVPVGASGLIRLHNVSAQAVSLVIDLEGFYSTPLTASQTCQVPAGHRITNSLTTIYPTSALADNDPVRGATNRATAWQGTINTLWLTDCMNSITIPTLLDTHSGSDPGRWYTPAGSTTGEPTPDNTTVVDSLASLQQGLTKQQQLFPKFTSTTFKVYLGLIGDDAATYPYTPDWQVGQVGQLGLAGVSTTAQGAAWAAREASQQVAVAKDVWTSYPGLQPWIAGFYLPTEADANTRVLSTPVQQTAFASYLAQASAGLHAISSSLQVMFAPSYVPPVGEASSAQQTPAQFGAWLKAILGTPADAAHAVDIVNVQDRLWAYDPGRDPSAPITGMVPYFQQARAVIDGLNQTSPSAMALWSDVELFQAADAYSSLPARDILDALTAEEPSVDGFSSYSAQNDLDYGLAGPITYAVPLTWFDRSQPPGDAYAYFVQTGQPDPNTVAASSITVSAANSGGNIVVSTSATDPYYTWTNSAPAPKNIGYGSGQVLEERVYRSVNGGAWSRDAVCFYNDYDYGGIEVHNCGPGTAQIPTPATVANPADPNPIQSTNQSATWTFADPQVPAGTQVSYRVEVVNAAGNTTNSNTVSITAAATSHGAADLAADAPYQVTDTDGNPVAASTSYPDTGHPATGWGTGELTDTSTDQTATFTNPAWSGYLANPTVITIDLGSAQPIGDIDIDALQATGGDIDTPPAIHIDTSTDDSSWVSYGDTARPTTGLSSADQTLTYHLPAVTATTARYLKITLYNDAWLFLDEISGYSP